MSTVYLAIENISEEDEAWETYSVIDNMIPYRVEIGGDFEFNAYDTSGNRIKDAQLSQILINEVKEFRKREK